MSVGRHAGLHTWVQLVHDSEGQTAWVPPMSTCGQRPAGAGERGFVGGETRFPLKTAVLQAQPLTSSAGTKSAGKCRFKASGECKKKNESARLPSLTNTSSGLDIL